MTQSTSVHLAIYSKFPQHCVRYKLDYYYISIRPVIIILLLGLLLHVGETGNYYIIQ